MYDVLILDDDPLLRMTFSEILIDADLSVRAVASVGEAWEVLKEPVGVRLLLADRDLGTPSGTPDGFAFAARALVAYPSLLVIYASGMPSALDGRSLTERERALPKPFLPSALVALVKEIAA